MNYIQRQLEDREHPVYRIDGSVDQQTRILMISEFKKASTNAVFVIQVKSGGQGLNLQEATRVYITAPSWNPATELQVRVVCRVTDSECL
jgi:SNF2 family DNA or RNA helicase